MADTQNQMVGAAWVELGQGVTISGDNIKWCKAATGATVGGINGHPLEKQTETIRAESGKAIFARGPKQGETLLIYTVEG